MRRVHATLLTVVAFLYALPAQAASDLREVGYSFISHGHVIRVASLAPRAISRMPGGVTIAQVDNGPYRLLPVGLDGIVVADAPVGTGSAQVGISSVVAGSTNLVCSTTSGAVTCDLATSPSVTSLTATGSSPLALTNASGTTTIASSTTGTLDVTTVANSTTNGTTFEKPSAAGASSATVAINGLTVLEVNPAGVDQATQFLAPPPATNSNAVYTFATTATCNTPSVQKIVVFTSPSTGTAANLTCSGDFITFGSLVANSIMNGSGQLRTENAAQISGVFGKGAIVAGTDGILGDDTACAPTASNLANATVTATNGMACKIIIGGTGSITTSVAITYLHTYNTSPDILATMGKNTNNATIKSCVQTSTSVVTCTFSTAMALNDYFFVHFVGGQ